MQKKISFAFIGLYLLIFCYVLVLLSSCAMTTSCGMNKKQAKAKHKMYVWR